jgi:hypothetical protein
MTDTTEIASERPDEELNQVEISDAALEAAALKGSAGAYTQFGLCTVSYCNG